jgi:hypothetical protein
MDSQESQTAATSPPPQDTVGRTDQRQYAPGQGGQSFRDGRMYSSSGEYLGDRPSNPHRGSRQYDGETGDRGGGGYDQADYGRSDNTQHWGRGRGGFYGMPPYGFNPFLMGLLYSQIMQQGDEGNLQAAGMRTRSGRFREGHGNPTQHYEPWPETFAHMGYPDVPFHPGLQFESQQGYNPFPPMVYGGMPSRTYGHPGAMQHSGPSMMSAMNNLHINMAPDEVQCMEDIFRKVLHAYEHYRLRGGSPHNLKQITIDLER